MTREEAFVSMKDSDKITHSYFSEGEYYHFKQGKILSEDGE